MKLLFLGTGTSTGVPQIGCDCETCRSLDPCDKRLRCSALLTTDTGKNILIDCGPDVRYQLLHAGSPGVDAVLLTHSHYDHVGGIDDMRPYCKEGMLPVYCTADVARDLRNRVPYCFAENPYPGVPALDLREIVPGITFTVAGIEIEPLQVMHYKLPIVGYRFGDLAYITDCKTMPQPTVERLRGVKTLILNALRIEPHMSHLSLDESLALIQEINPQRAYLTHMSHDMGPQARITLPTGVQFAHDFMEIP